MRSRPELKQNEIKDCHRQKHLTLSNLHLAAAFLITRFLCRLGIRRDIVNQRNKVVQLRFHGSHGIGKVHGILVNSTLALAIINRRLLTLSCSGIT